MSKIIYEAFFIEEPTVLKTEFPPVHPNIFYHHLTVAFKPESLVNPELLGRGAWLKVVGQLTTDKVDVLIVETSYSIKKFPHITLSTAEGVKPSESNTEIEFHSNQIVYFDTPSYFWTRYGYFNGVEKVFARHSDRVQTQADEVAIYKSEVLRGAK